ncbi:MAG: MBL fold metallo-hydrolase [Desulfovibrio sp.]|nr:MBL fold metallo-hydrolase [Desulfovibrio sp.]
MAVAAFPLGPLGTNSYVIDKDKQAVAIDVGGDPEPVLDYLKTKSLSLVAICITHLHFDHVYGVADLSKITGAPVYAPEADKPIEEFSKGGIWGMPPVPPFSWDPITLGKTSFGDMECVVLRTPGHTPGGISLYFPEQKCVFTGDALFYRSLGRTDFPLGDYQLLLRSIHETLFALPDDTIVYPGHGPATTIGDEKKFNPFCGEYAM